MSSPAAGEAQPRKRKRPPKTADPSRAAADPNPTAAAGRTRADARRARAAARWPAATPRSRGWSVRYALIAYLFTGVVGLAFSAVFRLGLGLRVPFGFGALFIELTMLTALIPLRRAGRLRARDLGLRAAPAARSVGLCLLGLVAYFSFEALCFNVFGAPRTGSVFAGIAQRSTLVILVTGFTAAVGAPVVEEIFFRGLVYRCLRNRLGTLPAASAAALLFVLIHAPSYPLVALPGIAGFGLVACLLYQRTGSLVPGIAIHSFVDASAFESALTGRITITFDVALVLALGLLTRATIRRASRRLTRRAFPVG